MSDKRFNRKLTAILSAGVEGYSRLMGDDAASLGYVISRSLQKVA